MQGRVLITGITGMVGDALARRLVREGVPVSGAIRASLRSKPIPGVEYIAVGEIGLHTDWRAALQGVEHVVHAAALTMGDKAALYRVNVEGTLGIAAAAVDHAATFLLISSLGVHGRMSIDRPFQASDAPNPHDAYSQSKLLAEQVMLKQLHATNTAWIIVRPPMIYGGRSQGTARRLQQAVRRGWPLPLGAVRNQLSIIGAENLVDFLCFALRTERAYRSAWLVADEDDFSTAELLRLVAEAEGVSLALPSVPVGLLRAFGQLFGRVRDIERLTESLHIDRSAVRNALGWYAPRATLAEWCALMRTGLIDD